MLILERYISRQFLQTFIFSLLALYVIFLVVNLLENLDDFLDSDANTGVIIKYYTYMAPEIFKILTPIAMLLACLFSVGKIANQNEITAMKSGGMSLYRIMTPLVFIGLIVSFTQLYFNGWIVPVANSSVIDIEQEYLKKGSRGTTIYNLYFLDSPTRHLTMQYYHSNLRSGANAAIEEYSSTQHPRLIKRTEAKTIKWDSTRRVWILYDLVIRNYDNGRVNLNIIDSLKPELNLTHDQIIQLKKVEKEMNLDELKEYIDLHQRGGKDVRKQLVNYHGLYAFPFANLVVILFGVPFASIRKKNGMAVQIAAAMIIAFVYLIFTKIGQAVGISSNFSPLLSGWLANIIFFIFGLIVIIRTRT